MPYSLEPVRLSQTCLAYLRNSVCRWSLFLCLSAIAVLLWRFPAQAGGATMVSVKPQTATLYERPSTKGAVLGTLPRDYPLRVLQKRREWRKVTDFVGWQGWVRLSDLNSTKTVVVTKDMVNIRERPSLKARVTLRAKRYVTFLLLKVQGAWLKVKHRDGEVGWLRRSVTWGS